MLRGGALSLLLVEDDVRVAAAYSKQLTGFDVVVARDVADACAAIHDLERDFSGGVFDIVLPGGSGLDVLEEFRQYYPTAPALVATGVCDASAINRTQVFGAEFAMKPMCLENLRDFASRVGDSDALEASERLARFARRYSLSPRERRILERAAEGVPRRRMAAHLGVSENTIKSQVRSLLVKTGHRRLAEALLELNG